MKRELHEYTCDDATCHATGRVEVVPGSSLDGPPVGWLQYVVFKVVLGAPGTVRILCPRHREEFLGRTMPPAVAASAPEASS